MNSFHLNFCIRCIVEGYNIEYTIVMNIEFDFNSTHNLKYILKSHNFFCSFYPANKDTKR